MTDNLPSVNDIKITKEDLEQFLFGSNIKLTEAQKALFFQIAMRCNLDPFRREIHAIPYGDRFNVVVGYEVYLKRAERTGLLEWWEAGVKKEGNEYVGWCTIKRKDRTKPTTIEAWFNEYNQHNAMWKMKPRTMIRKVAIAQAFRMVFPEELGGLPYTSDELPLQEGEVAMEPPSLPPAPPSAEEPQEHPFVQELRAKGKLANAEKFLGKPASQWTQEDIDQLIRAKEWHKLVKQIRQNAKILGFDADEWAEAQGGWENIPMEELRRAEAQFAAEVANMNQMIEGEI